MMFILDTDILTLHQSGNRAVVEQIQRLGFSQVSITIVTVYEVLRGRFEYLLKAIAGGQLQRASEYLDRSVQLLSEIQVVKVDQAAASEFDRLLAIRQLRKIGRPDILIASIAIANQATLVTRNVKDFKTIPGIKLADWSR